MPRCQFSEDEYEDHLIHEMRHLYGGGELHYKPTRRQEFWLGYDFAVLTNVPWLSAPGLHLNASYLTSHIPLKNRWQMPARMANVFVQCKVPDSVTRRGIKNQSRWARWNGPYLSIELEENQLKRLGALARILGATGVVCYAAPCFVRHEDCDVLVPAGAVCQRSHFQDAQQLERNLHTVYTYRDPNTPGWGFSEPELLEGWSFFRAVGVALEQSPIASVAEHTEKLWGVLQRAEIPLEVTRADMGAARRLVGELADELLHPFEGRGTTLAEVVAMSISIRHMAREYLGARWVQFCW
jgi:hypothetical protein